MLWMSTEHLMPASVPCSSRVLWLSLPKGWLAGAGHGSGALLSSPSGVRFQAFFFSSFSTAHLCLGQLEGCHAAGRKLLCKENKCHLLQQLCFKHNKLHLDHWRWGCLCSCITYTRISALDRSLQDLLGLLYWVESEHGRNKQPQVNLLSLGQTISSVSLWGYWNVSSAEFSKSWLWESVPMSCTRLLF